MDVHFTAFYDLADHDQRTQLATARTGRTPLPSNWDDDMVLEVARQCGHRWLAATFTTISVMHHRGARTVDDIVRLHTLNMSQSEIRAYGTAEVRGVDTIIALHRICDGYTARKLHRAGFRGVDAYIIETQRRAQTQLDLDDGLADQAVSVTVVDHGQRVTIHVNGRILTVDDADQPHVAASKVMAVFSGTPSRVDRIQTQWAAALATGTYAGVITGPLARHARRIRRRDWATGVLAGDAPFTVAATERLLWDV